MKGAGCPVPDYMLQIRKPARSGCPNHFYILYTRFEPHKTCSKIYLLRVLSNSLQIALKYLRSVTEVFCFRYELKKLAKTVPKRTTIRTVPKYEIQKAKDRR